MEQNQRSTPSIRLLVFSLLLLTAGFRIVRLTADPPSDFSWSGGYFADEGYWSHNARNEVLFGKAVLDEWDAEAMSPVFATIQLWTFRLLGVGLAQVRLIGVLSSLLLSISSFFLFRKQFSPGHSFLMSLLVALNYPMLILGRQGILDPFATALAWTALMLLLVSESPVAAFSAGILFVAACVTKYLMIYAIAPLGVALWLAMNRKNGPRFVLLCITGAVSAFCLWFFADYSPHRELISMYGKYYSSQQSWQVADLIKNMVRQPFYLYFAKSPAILFLGNLMLWYFLGRFATLRSEARPAGPRPGLDPDVGPLAASRPVTTSRPGLGPAGRASILDHDTLGKVEKICWVWLVCGIVFFAFWRYRPERYYTSLLPPLAGLAGAGLLRLPDLIEQYGLSRIRLFVVAGMLLPAFQFLFLLCDDWFGWNYVPQEAGIGHTDAIIFLLLTIASLAVLVKRYKSKWIVIAFGLAFLLGDLRSYVVWAADPPLQAVFVARELQQEVGDGVLAGQWAPEMCLENRVRVVPVWHGFVNSEDPIRKYGITHLLLWRYPLGDEIEKFAQWYPEEFKQFRPVKRYTIKNSEVVLFEKEAISH